MERATMVPDSVRERMDKMRERMREMREQMVRYPETKKIEQTDDYFEENVADPYRWLEDDRSAETEAWVVEQNKITFGYLEKIPFRTALKEKLTKLADYEKYGSPFKKNGKYYFYKNDGLQNQSVLYVQNSLKDEAKVFLDPNKLSDDGTVALGGISFSNNGKYFAYTVSRSGSDWREIYVMDLATGKLLNDHIKWAKFTSAVWHGDGFYYSAYDAPEKGKEFSSVNENHKIYYHKIGDPQEKDELIYENKKYPKRFYTCSVDEDETYMFIYESGEGRGNNLYMKYLETITIEAINRDGDVGETTIIKDHPIIQIANNMDNSYSPIAVLKDRILIMTNDNAPKYKIMEVKFSAPEQKNWKVLIPEAKNVLSSASVIGNKLILNYEQDASSHVYRYDLNGKMLNEIKLPALGTANFSGKKNDNEAFFTFTSFTFPTSIYRYDVETDKTELYRRPKVDFKPEEYITEQVFFASKDGTKIPMFLTYKKGLEKNGQNPVLLYGYGGFNISLTPSFSTSRLPFLENGGIYVSVNLRGGSEYGEDWHIAGTKLQKQNVFDDFIFAAQYMIEQKYTNPSKIAIMGGSNGGLLVGAVVNQRPNLFRVAIPQVGVMDMLRYHKFTIGWNWASDYGTSEDSKEMFEYLYAYSPLHNLKRGVPYPATLITTADHDDRVVPAHSFKYAAALQAANVRGFNPTLIRIDTKSGHGAGKPITKVIEEQADIYSFIFWNLGMELNGAVSKRSGSLNFSPENKKWEYQAIINKIRNCIADDSIRIIQTKNYEMIYQIWRDIEMEKEKRFVTTNLNKATGVCTAMSSPNRHTDGKKMSRKMMKEDSKKDFEIFQKVKKCLAEEDIRIIESKDYEVIKAWTKEETETEKRIVKISPKCENGIYIAVSKAKTENGE
jgi:prolyl oligopeptidase